MNEIFELNSLLRGEDSERIELEKKKVSLVTAVQHQESRFLHEFEEITKLEAELTKFETRANQVYSEIYPGLDIASRTKEVDSLTKSIIQLLTEKEEIKCLLNKGLKELEILESNMKSNPSVDEVLHLKSSLSSNRAKESDLRKNIELLTRQEDQFTMSLEEATGKMRVMEINFQSMKESLANLDNAFQKAESKMNTLQEYISATSQLITQLEDRKQKLLVDLENIQYQEQELISKQQIEKSTHNLNLEVEHHRLDGAQYDQYARQVHISKLQNQVLILEKLRTKLKSEIARFEIDESFSNSELRILREEEEMLRTQKKSLVQNAFSDRLQYLELEISHIQNNVNDILQRTAQIENQIRNPELHTYLYQQLQNIQQKCVRKEHLLDEIQRLEKDINDQNSMIRSLKSGAKELETEFVLCTAEASQLLKNSESTIARSSALAEHDKNLSEAVSRREGELDDMFYQLGDDTSKLISVDTNLQNLKQKLKQKEARTRERVALKKTQMKSEISRRVLETRNKRQDEMRKQLNIMEAALLEEDRVFQSTISTLQENLLANKAQLQNLLATAHTQKHEEYSIRDLQSAPTSMDRIPFPPGSRSRKYLKRSLLQMSSSETSTTAAVPSTNYFPLPGNSNRAKENLPAQESNQQIRQSLLPVSKENTTTVSVKLPTSNHNSKTEGLLPQRKQARMRGTDI